MKQPRISRRRFLEGSFVTAGAVCLPACGGGGEAAPEVAETGTATAAGATKGLAPSPVTIAPTTSRATTAPAGTAGSLATRLKITGAQAGIFPFSATVMPLRGAVPLGRDIESPDDGSLRSSTLSRHDDGSVAVAVVSGKVTLLQAGSVTVRLQAGPRTAPTALTPEAIAGLVKQVSVAFGPRLGTATLSNFRSPERVWWANASTVCARYRVAAPTPGSTALEAIIDIQAWGDRALVEVTIENAKMLSAQPVKPAVADYTQATVTVNGALVATGNGSGVPGENGHNAFRAWHCRTWVGAGDPKLVAHQDVADLQQHPLLFKMDQACSVDLSGYASDTYVQWGFGRKPGAYMGGVGDVPAIGPLTQWDARWLQSGDARAAHAVDVQALMTLHWNINHRDSSTGRVPTHAQVDGKSINGSRSWPQQTNSANALQWELMHHPAVGLAAFLVRPSPVFIEIAQKIAIWNAMWPTNWESNTVHPTGVFRGGGCTTRGRAWALRSLAHAIFLTPDELAVGQPDPWKPAAKVSLQANIAYLDGYRTDPKSKLNITWEGDPALPQNIPYQTAAQSGPVFATRGWFSHYLITEMHKLSSARLLVGDGQAAAKQLADWLAGFPVRWVNEQAGGGWRYLPYSTAMGRNTTTIDMPDTWGAMTDYVHFDRPLAASGPWFFSTGDSATYATDYGSQDTNRPRYVDYFWAALVAAVERAVPGADRAWNTVNANVTNIATWRTGFGNEPRWGSTPRGATVAAGGAGGLGTVTPTVPPGEWLEWTNSTNVRQITNVNPQTGVATGWLESRPNAVMTTWPGKMTWDPERKQLIVVGAAAGGSGDVPAGLSTAALFLDITTKTFTKQWNPFNRNSWHVYDANSTRPLGGFIYRTAPQPATLFKMDLATRVWSQADDLAPMNLGYAAVPALEVHPTLGAQGSILVSGTNGRIGRIDRASGAVTVLATTLPGVAGLSPVISYHPGIDAVVFGGGEGGNTLYKISNTGAITPLTTALPPGVPSLSPDSSRGNTVLAPDPQGRPVAWVFDMGTTRKVWRLDLNTGSWADAGTLPSTFASSAGACVGTVPELGVHVWFDGNGRENATTSGARVWVYKPA